VIIRICIMTPSTDIDSCTHALPFWEPSATSARSCKSGVKARAHSMFCFGGFWVGVTQWQTGRLYTLKMLTICFVRQIRSTGLQPVFDFRPRVRTVRELKSRLKPLQLFEISNNWPKIVECGCDANAIIF